MSTDDTTPASFPASGLTRTARRIRGIVALVAAINFAGFAVEATVGLAIGSAALLADAADFLEDFLINLLVVSALSWPVASRRKASYVLAGLILIPATAALGMAVYKLFTGQPPEPTAMSATAIAAGVVNLVCAGLLAPLRHANTPTPDSAESPATASPSGNTPSSDSATSPIGASPSANALTRGAWLAARNDVAANLLIALAGFITLAWWSIWPDIITGAIIAVINLSAAKEVFEQARAEDPEIE